MAADSRGTIGDPRGVTAINDSQEKLFELGKCGLALSGASEMGSALLDEYRRREIGSIKHIDEMAQKVAANECRSFFELVSRNSP